MPEFSAGARVVMPVIKGMCGLATVHGVEERNGRRVNVVQLDMMAQTQPDAVIRVPVDIASYPWPAPTPAEARVALAKLLVPGAPDPRPWKERYGEFVELVKSCDHVGLANFAKAQWARGQPANTGEQKVGRMLKALVVDPVAEAVGMDSDALHSKLVAH